MISEIMQGITTQYDLSSTGMSYLSSVPLYLDHAPQNVDYPIITYKVISSPRSWAMNGSTPFKYANARIQFSVYGNENQLEDCMKITDQLESVFDFIPLTLNNGVTHICTKIMDESVAFYNENEKIWTVVQDMRIRTGK